MQTKVNISILLLIAGGMCILFAGWSQAQMPPTPPVQTLTPASVLGAPPVYLHPPAGFSAPDGWSCGDFPCETDIEGFLRRIQVPTGYEVSHVGRFPGQPMQITYGADGSLYGTVLLNGTRTGAVYRLDARGNVLRFSDYLVSPIGLAFQPGTETLYISSRITLEAGGRIWRLNPDGRLEIVVDQLPCCFLPIDNQPNGMTFGPDGYLYIGVGSLTDHAEPDNPRVAAFATLDPLEASILRVHPHTGAVEIYAAGIRNPYDVAFDAGGVMYATDNGLLSGVGDRIVAGGAGSHFGWPYWRTRGCENCPALDPRLAVSPDYVRFPDYTLPRGLTVYTGQQFPQNIYGSMFVALWHNTPDAQRIVRIDPRSVPTDDALATYTPEPFVTGLIRPVDVVVAPDGSLVIADFIYGNVWRVSYTGAGRPTPAPTATPGLFVTNTPRP